MLKINAADSEMTFLFLPRAGKSRRIWSPGECHFALTRVTVVIGVRHNKQPGDLEAEEGAHVTLGQKACRILYDRVIDCFGNMKVRRMV